MEYKRILLGMDGSELMDPVYKHCAYLARPTNATVDIVQVVDTDGLLIEYPVVQPDTENVYDDLLTAGENCRTYEASTALAGNVGEGALTVAVLEGHPCDAIHAYMKDYAIDLVVIGTHRRWGVHRLHLGSVADGVVRGTQVPCS
jgi:nucleotide-binding universal stress UspA family protein